MKEIPPEPLPIVGYSPSNGLCPYCGCDDLGWSSPDIEEDYIYQDVVCRGCGKVWADQYVFNKIVPMYND